MTRLRETYRSKRKMKRIDEKDIKRRESHKNKGKIIYNRSINGGKQNQGGGMNEMGKVKRPRIEVGWGMGRIVVTDTEKSNLTATGVEIIFEIKTLH